MTTAKISGIYKCHSDYSEEDFIIDFEEFITANKNNKNHIIIGDVNIDLTGFDKRAEEYFYSLMQNGYMSMMNTVTKPNNTGGTCIDHIFMKSTLQGTAGKLLVPITDHCLTILLINGNATPKTKEKIEISKHRFISLCEFEPWHEISQIDDNEEALVLHL